MYVSPLLLLLTWFKCIIAQISPVFSKIPSCAYFPPPEHPEAFLLIRPQTLALSITRVHVALSFP